MSLVTVGVISLKVFWILQLETIVQSDVAFLRQRYARLGKPYKTLAMDAEQIDREQ